MRGRTLVFSTLLLAIASTPSVAQQSVPGPDGAYCDKLIYLYERYIGGYEAGPSAPITNGDMDGKVGVAKCRQGDTATGIPMLERRLKANGFTLPQK